MNGQSVTLEGDGRQSRDFTYVGDLVKVLCESLNRQDHDNEVVNLAFGKQVSLLDILTLLKEKFTKVEVIEAKERTSDIRNSLNDPRRLNELYPGILPNVFESSIDLTISWLKLNQDKIKN